MKYFFVHGLGQTAGSWEKVMENLPARDDCIGLNLSELTKGDEVSYGTLYRRFAEACGQTEGTIALYGLSLGSVLALNYAIEHPERVHSLVLIAPQYKMPRKLLRFQNFIFRLMPSRTFQKMGFGKHDFIRLCSTMEDLDFSGSLGKVTCPTLIICGEKDAANRRAAAELASSLSNAELQVIHGAGHEANVEAPEALAKALECFWSAMQ